MHKTMNVLNCMSKLSQPKAKADLHDIWQAETKVDSDKAFDLFIKTYEPKYPKTALRLQKDRDELMAFFRFPPNAGKASAPAIQLNPYSPRSGTEPNAQRGA